MASCPNCSYALILLQHRNKYKCALCGRLYPQKEIDAKEFREMNKRQRILGLENYERERREELAKIRELKRDIKRLFNGFPEDPKEHMKKYYRNNKEKIKERNKEWKQGNKEKIRKSWRKNYAKNRGKELERCEKYRETHKEQRLLARKLWEEKNKSHRTEWQKSYLEKNRNLDLQKKRLNFWRKKQEQLAMHQLENELIEETLKQKQPSLCIPTAEGFRRTF